MKFSGFSAYAMPYRMEVVRGTLVWNHVTPDVVIRPMDYVNMFKLSTETEEDFDRVFEDSYEKGLLDEIDVEKLRAIREYVFGTEELKHYGFTRICIPKTVEEIPGWVKPFIDTEEVISNNVRAALLLLETLGIVCFEVKGKDRFSNIIRF
jgi:hypothetical protein